MNKKLKVTQTFINGVATQVHHIPETGQGSVHRKSGFWIFRMDTFRQIPHPPTMRYFEFYNISHCLEGDAYYRTPNRADVPVHPGDCILEIPNHIHYYGGHIGSTYLEDSLSFAGPIAEMLHSSGVLVPGVYHFSQNRKLLPIFELLQDPSDHAQLNAGFALQTIIYTLYNRKHQEGGDLVFRGIDELLESLKTSEHIWTVEEMIEFCNLNKDTFRKLLRKRTGMNPKLYQDRLRFNQAARLLLETNLPVAEIARQIGFFDPFHFSRRFKTVMSLPPQDYRKKFGLQYRKLGTPS